MISFEKMKPNYGYVPESHICLIAIISNTRFSGWTTDRPVATLSVVPVLRVFPAELLCTMQRQQRGNEALKAP